MLILIGFVIVAIVVVLWAGTQVSGSLAEEEEAIDKK